MSVGVAYALIGGMLSVLMPCSALLIPAFFAHTAVHRGRLIVLGGAFLAGTLTTLVPLGLAVGWAGGRITLDRLVLIQIAAWVVVALGVALIFGLGFDASKLVGGAPKARSGIAGAYILGLAGGVTGFCTGPVLGAILTLVLTGGSPIGGGLLFAVYGLGLALPIVGIAGLIRMLGGRTPRWLRGKTVRIAGRGFHTTNLIAGAITIAMGLILALNPSLIASSGFIGHDTSDAITDWARGLDAALSPAVWAVIVVAVLGTIWIVSLVRKDRQRRG